MLQCKILMYGGQPTQCARMATTILAAVLMWALAFMLFVPTVRLAHAGITIDDMNKLIDQTNFILDNVCSATLISVKHRLVLTNYHCVEGKIKIIEREEKQPDGTMKRVRRPLYNDTKLTQKAYSNYEIVGDSTYVAEIIATNKKQDLALLQIKAPSIPHTLESRLLPDGQTIRRLEKVWTVGNPAMFDATAVEGIVSNTNRSIEWAPGDVTYYFQVSGGMFGGNSGGAAYNADGFFIGVPGAGVRAATHIGFVIPVDIIKAWLREECWEELWNEHAKPYSSCKAEKSRHSRQAGSSSQDDQESDAPHPKADNLWVESAPRDWPKSAPLVVRRPMLDVGDVLSIDF